MNSIRLLARRGTSRPAPRCAASATESGRRSIKDPGHVLSDDLGQTLTLDQDNLDLSQGLGAPGAQLNPDLKIGIVGGDTDSVFLHFRLRLRCDDVKGAGVRACYGGLVPQSHVGHGSARGGGHQGDFGSKPSMILEMEKFFSIEAVIVKKYIGRVITTTVARASWWKAARSGDTIGLVRCTSNSVTCCWTQGSNGSRRPWRNRP